MISDIDNAHRIVFVSVCLVFIIMSFIWGPSESSSFVAPAAFHASTWIFYFLVLPTACSVYITEIITIQLITILFWTSNIPMLWHYGYFPSMFIVFMMSLMQYY